MYDYCEKCSHCSCCMRHLCSISVEDLRKWCNDCRKKKGMTIQDVANAIDVPTGTVNRFLSTENTEFRYSTVAPIITYFISLEECPIHSFEWTTDYAQKSEELQHTVNTQRIVIFSLLGVMTILVSLIVTGLIVDFFSTYGFFWH